MNYVTLGNTGLRVSRFILGSMQLGWLLNEKESFELLDAALEAGINTIDTADIYSRWTDESYPGKSEEIIGRWMKERGVREEIILATKVRGKMSDRPNDKGLSRKHITEGARASLNRLQIDWIDLYWSHWPDEEVDQEVTLRAFDKLIDEGSIHHIGASNHTAAQIVESLWISDSRNLASYDAIQPPYSLARRKEYEKYLRPVVRKYDLGVTPYSPLGGGFLTGKYSKHKTPDSKRAESIEKRYATEENYRIVEELGRIADNRGVSIPQIALAWILTKDSITAPIIGASSLDHLHDNLGALDIELSREETRALNDVSDWRDG